MRIAFQLNGSDISVEVPPEKRLVDVIREDCGLRGTKSGCYAGDCGSCTIIMNGDVVQSCLIPSFAARGAEVMTIEGFSRTRAFREIQTGFAESGYAPCSYCHQARVLSAHALLQRSPTPSRADILEMTRGITCRCTDLATLYEAIGRIAILRGRGRRGIR